MIVPWNGPSNVSQSILADAEETINWVPEPADVPNAATPLALYPTPGLSSFASLPTTPCRGMLSQNGRLFVVAGDTSYEVLSDGSYNTLGSMVLDSNPVTISTNGPAGHQVFITSGYRGYIYDLISGTFSFVTGSLPGVSFGGFLDGYFLGLDVPNSTLYISALEDGTSWSSSDAAQRNTSGDKWVSMIVSHREAWLFGGQRTDVWRNVGDPNFPFAPIDGAFIEQGILAPFSAVIIDNAPMWLGQNENGSGVVWRANGYTPQRVSTFAMEYYIQSMTTVTDAVGMVYQDGGHSYYGLNFPTENVASPYYDAATGLWHKRGYWNSPLQQYQAWRPQYHAYCFGKHLVGDRLTGNLYDMSIAYASDVGEDEIRRLRRGPHYVKDLDFAFYKWLQVYLEPGLGLQSGQGSDPQVMLRWSDDGGKTWGNIHTMSAGAIGQYRTRVQQNRLGYARDRVFEIYVSDPIVNWRVISAYLDVEAGIQ